MQSDIFLQTHRREWAEGSVLITLSESFTGISYIIPQKVNRWKAGFQSVRATDLRQYWSRCGIENKIRQIVIRIYKLFWKETKHKYTQKYTNGRYHSW